MASERMMGDDPETLKLGNYDILKREDGSQWRLGQGAYGTTYKAEHRHLRRIAALKVINDSLVQNNQARQRFLHEAQSAASLDHANIAKIYDFGDHDGVFYYAMEFCEGGTLEDLSAGSGGMPWNDVRILARGIGRALEHAHDKGLLHRDLKPANAMLRHPADLSSVKLIDFGLVKVLDPEKSDSTNLALTREGSFMGNPLTASPEQLNEEELDERSDLFSLGITLWCLLLGRSPFENLSAAKVVHERLNDSSYLDQVPDDLPAHARAVLGKLIEKQHERRFASAREFLDALADPSFGEETAAPADSGSDPVPASAPARDTASAAPPQREVVISSKIADVTSGPLYRARDRETGEPLAVLYPPKAHIEEVEKHLERLAKLPPCCVLRYRHEAEFEEDHILVFDSLEGATLSELLKAKGAHEFRRCLALLRPIAEAIDIAADAGLPGLELHPESVWIAPSPPGSAAPYRVQLVPVMVAPDQPFDAGATLAGSDLDTPGFAQFGALVYRLVAGMAVKQMAFHTTNAYVNTAGLAEESNRFLSEAISNLQPHLRAAGVLATLAQLEGTPLEEADAAGRALFEPSLFPAPADAEPPQELVPPSAAAHVQPPEAFAPPAELVPPAPPSPAADERTLPAKKKKKKRKKRAAKPAEAASKSEPQFAPAPQPVVREEPSVPLEPAPQEGAAAFKPADDPKPLAQETTAPAPRPDAKPQPETKDEPKPAPSRKTAPEPEPKTNESPEGAAKSAPPSALKSEAQPVSPPPPQSPPKEPAPAARSPERDPAGKSRKLAKPLPKAPEPVPAGTRSESPRPAPRKKRKRGVLVSVLLLLVLGGAGVFAITSGKLGEWFAFKSNPSSSPKPATEVSSLVLTVTGLAISPLPDELVVRQSNEKRTLVATIVGSPDGTYRLPIPANARDAYHWPLNFTPRLDGYEPSEPIRLSDEMLLLSKSSASATFAKPFTMRPSTHVRLLAKADGNEAPLRPADLVAPDASVAPSGGAEENMLKIQGPAGSRYPINLTVQVPGFDPQPLKIEQSSPKELSLALTRARANLNIATSGFGIAFAELTFTPDPEYWSAGIARDLTAGEGRFTVATTAHGGATLSSKPTGRYLVTARGNVLDNAALPPLVLAPDTKNWAIPPQPVGAFEAEQAGFALINREAGFNLDLQEANYYIWLLPGERAGPRLVVLGSEAGEIYDLAAPLANAKAHKIPEAAARRNQGEWRWSFDVLADAARNLNAEDADFQRRTFYNSELEITQSPDGHLSATFHERYDQDKKPHPITMKPRRFGQDAQAARRHISEIAGRLAALQGAEKDVRKLLEADIAKQMIGERRLSRND